MVEITQNVGNTALFAPNGMANDFSRMGRKDEPHFKLIDEFLNLLRRNIQGLKTREKPLKSTNALAGIGILSGNGTIAFTRRGIGLATVGGIGIFLDIGFDRPVAVRSIGVGTIFLRGPIKILLIALLVMLLNNIDNLKI